MDPNKSTSYRSGQFQPKYFARHLGDEQKADRLLLLVFSLRKTEEPPQVQTP